MNLPLPKALALLALNTLCRLFDKAICAWPNTTDDPACPVCKRTDCTKEC